MKSGNYGSAIFSVQPLKNKWAKITYSTLLVHIISSLSGKPLLDLSPHD